MKKNNSSARLLFVLFFLSPLFVRGQQVVSSSQLLPLYDSLTLDTMHAFTDLAEAMKQPDKVVKLVLRKQKLKAVPKEIWSFPNLQYLDLSKNQITDFPDTLYKLQNLQVLHLSRNKISGLPREIGDLSNIVILDINNNDLTMLPQQIGKLHKLQYLDLWSNDLYIFPDEMGELKDNLKVLDLRVILINVETQERIQKLLPNTTIYFSQACKCGE